MTFTETDEKIIAGMRAALKDRGPDWTYPAVQRDENGEYIDDEWHDLSDCVNTLFDGSAACLVGYALIEADLGDVPRSGSSGETLARMGIEADVSTNVKAALNLAQAAQDEGKPWGEAMEKFEAIINKEEV